MDSDIGHRFCFLSRRVLWGGSRGVRSRGCLSWVVGRSLLLVGFAVVRSVANATALVSVSVPASTVTTPSGLLGRVLRCASDKGHGGLARNHSLSPPGDVSGNSREGGSGLSGGRNSEKLAMGAVRSSQHKTLLPKKQCPIGLIRKPPSSFFFQNQEKR